MSVALLYHALGRRLPQLGLPQPTSLTEPQVQPLYIQLQSDRNDHGVRPK